MFLSIASAACLATFLSLISSSSYLAEKAPYASFAKDATSAPQKVYYDYIVIGGGTAGCGLAATLSQFANVLVLERGGLPYDHTIHMNKGTAILALLNILPNSPAQLFFSEDGVLGHRGRVLGGSSVLNFGFYSHARDEDVRDAGWDPELVSESYKWVESKLVFKPPMQSWQQAYRDGLLGVGVTPYRGYTYEHLSGTKVGSTIFDENGVRHSAADLLEYADPANITVLLHATVHQILFDTTQGEKPKAYGVLFQDSEGVSHTAYLNKFPTTNEIIVSAGAIGSPQLLMLSGIGPSQQLQALDIEVVLDQAMVGQGMADNSLNGVVIPSPNRLELSLVEAVGITDGDTNYIESGSGLIEIPWDQFIQNQTLNKILVQAAKLALRLIGTNNTQAGMMVQKVAQPFSKGYMELKSRDPNDNPKVTFNYFQDPRDVQTCVQGMQIIKEVVESTSFSKFRYPFVSFQALMTLVLIAPLNLREKHIESTYSMEQFCKDTVMSYWHYRGGCLLDEVVDRDYKVIGVDSLRVIDASTFSNSPGTNPQATIMMLGRYMGQKINRERNSYSSAGAESRIELRTSEMLNLQI